MPTDLTLVELAALADVAPRTIRYYIAQGLVPAPGRDGPGTRYPASTLDRLRLIRQLQRGHLPLAEIRRRLEALDDDEVAALVGPGSVEPPAGSALDYVRSVLAPAGAAAPVRSDLDRPPAPPPSPALRRSPMSGEPAASTPPSVPSASERSQWERIVLEPDVELHVRRPASRIANKRVERLLAFARQLLEEDQP